MLRTIPDDTVDDEPEYFRFWTRSELTRVGCLMSLALAPLSFAAGDAPIEASSARRDEPSKGVQQSGFLRSVRTVEFHAGRFDMKAMGDVE
jgi:hypothetical protein